MVTAQFSAVINNKFTFLFNLQQFIHPQVLSLSLFFLFDWRATQPPCKSSLYFTNGVFMKRNQLWRFNIGTEISALIPAHGFVFLWCLPSRKTNLNNKKEENVCQHILVGLSMPERSSSRINCPLVTSEMDAAVKNYADWKLKFQYSY